MILYYENRLIRKEVYFLEKTKAKKSTHASKITWASFKQYIRETDKWLLLFTIAASVYGIMLVFSATYENRSEGALIPRDALVMMIAFLLGIVACMILSSIDYEIMTRLWILVAVGCVLLMVITLIFGTALNPERQDARSWLDFGPVSFQPSELVKVGFILTFSVHLDLVKEEINKLKNVILLCVHGAIPVLLVMLTGDDGSALIFMLIFACMMFAAGLHWGYFAVAFACLLVGIPILWYTGFIINDHQKERILALIRPEDYAQTTAFQQNRGMVAIGSGQITGKGYMQGSYTQNDMVPESQNDMIFTVAGEEFGFIGAAAVILVLALIIIKIIINGKRAKDMTGYLICMGIAAMIASQAVLNIGMCLQVMPVIGITLPFFSAGGSSNVCIYLAIGLAMSVYRFNQKRPAVDFRLSRIATAFSEK